MAAAQADPEIAKVVGPYQAILALPSSLDAVQARARDMYASGWRPPVPPGPTRDELAGLVTAAADSLGYLAGDAALSAATAPATPSRSHTKQGHRRHRRMTARLPPQPSPATAPHGSPARNGRL